MFGWHELGIDFRVLILALFGVPAGQAILDLAVGPRVLFYNRNQSPALGKNEGHFGTCRGSADNGDNMTRQRGISAHNFYSARAVATATADDQTPGKCRGSPARFGR